jgi:peptidoglycan hydrolase-like protein with peptidoglycan-binding domain
MSAYDPKRTFAESDSIYGGAQLNPGCFHALRFRQEMHMRALVILAGLFLVTCPASAKSLDAEAINNAQFGASFASKKAISPLLIKAEILLARAHFSPGEISGRAGENLTKAIAAFAEAQGKAANKLDQELWDKLVSMSADPAVVDYTISEADVRGPFVEKIPGKMEMMQDLPRLAYTTPREALAEKFHMSPELLSALNPGEKFEVAGHTILVANIPTGSLPEKVNRIRVDKAKQELRAFDAGGKLLAYYPATVGSEEKPAPSWHFEGNGCKEESHVPLQSGLRIQRS